MPISAERLGKRLKEAREACGLTQQQVVDLLDEHDVHMARATLAQTESGGRAVTSVELERLAFLFGRDMQHFLAEQGPEGDPVLALFRTDPDLPESGLHEALRRCIALGRELSNLERLLGVDRNTSAVASYVLAPPERKWDAIQQGERLARDERRRLGLGKSPIANMAELLDTQGIFAAVESMPDDVSGLTLVDPDIGVLVVVNEEHNLARRRFSYAHEYCHVLADRDRQGVVSRSSARDELTEIRANAFAAALLMPDYGIREFVALLGKGRASRLHSTVFDETNPVEARARSAPGSQDIQFYDVVQIANHFGASRSATIYRLKNLGLINQPQLESLIHMEGDQGRRSDLLAVLGREELEQASHRDRNARGEFRRRFMSMAMEAYRRREITRGKLMELARMVRVDTGMLERVLGFMDMAERDDGVGVLLPGDDR